MGSKGSRPQLVDPLERVLGHGVQRRKDSARRPGSDSGVGVSSMKYMENERFGLFNQALSSVEIGDKVITGRIELYSCKPTCIERKMNKELETSLRDEVDLRKNSPASAPSASSPLGDLGSSTTRKLLINLISTLNASFPDYDFSVIRPEQFVREHLNYVISDVNRHLIDLCETVNPSFLEDLWAGITENLNLKECEVYSYLPDMDGDPFSDGNLWSFNYFFVNKSLKRIGYFTCMAKSKFQSTDDDMECCDAEGGGTWDSGDEEQQYWVDL